MNTTWVEFPTKRGDVIHLGPVSDYDVFDVIKALTDRFDDEHGELKPPTYTQVYGGGPYGGEWIEEIEYDDQSIDDPTTPAIDRQAYREYKRLVRQRTRLRLEASVMAWLYFGVQEMPPDDKSWEDSRRAIGVDIPENVVEYKVFWIERMVAADPSEIKEMCDLIRGLSDGSEREASIASGTFQRSVEETGRTDSRGTEQETEEG